MLSGSDLDGDQYHICWEPGIVKEAQYYFERGDFYAPADFYIPLKDPSKRKKPEQDITDSLRVSAALIVSS